ncbi:MAG: YceI family protein [Candidatus Acidiferrales bacterium]
MFFFAAFILCGVAFAAAPARSQESVYTLDPAQTTIEFTLGATLHSVHGTFRLKSGEIRFDPKTGAASGAIIADAVSGTTGIDARDSKMHAQVLESRKYPEIIFLPQQVRGAISAMQISQVEVDGIFRMHGQDHPFRMMLSAGPPAGGRLATSGQFVIPYTQWGMKNPSNFFLHVENDVNVEIHAEGRLSAAAASPPEAPQK